MQAYKCDRCKKFYEIMGGEKNKQIAIYENKLTIPKIYDMCPNCYIEFKGWFNKYSEEDKDEG